jgi:DNA helicase HerA-like ATPase
MPDPLTPLGFHNYRGNKEEKFGIKLDDRRRHVYIIGKTGVGKTTLLENMAIADIKAGKGLCIVDPHGEFAEKLLDFIPEERLDDVIYFDPSDMEFPIAFNPMEQVGTEFRHLVASSLMGVFKKIWADAWSARMQYILNNTLLSLLEFPDATLLGILRMFSEPNYRKKIVDNLRDPVIKAFWQNEFSKYSQKFETEALAAIQNKVGQFVTNPLVRNILGQPRSTLNMRQMMDTGKIFIANLSKGKIGEDNSSLLGAMIITRLQLAAMSRVDIPEEKRRDFFMYVDEFQNFATDSFASILSEARKYRLSLVLAHQYISQLVGPEGNTKVRDAVFGNVGTIITFRIGAADAEFLEMEFMPEFLQNDLVNLSKANVYIKLMIDGVSSRPFSAQTLPPQKPPLVSYRDVIIKNSQQHYGTPRQVVEDRILAEWSGNSDTVVQEKITRRNEQGLSQALRSGTPGQSAPRSGGQGGQDSGPRPFQSSPSRPGAQQRPDFSQRSNPSPSSNPNQPVRPGGLPERRNTTFNTPARVVPPRITPVSDFNPTTSPSSVAPVSASAPVLRPEIAPKPQKPKHVPKNNIDIAELRRAISESLKRPGGAAQHPSADQAPHIDPVSPANPAQ